MERGLHCAHNARLQEHHDWLESRAQLTGARCKPDLACSKEEHCMSAQPELMRQTESVVDAILERTGKNIVLGMPLGLGKPNHFVNALYQRAKNDSSISLTIFTALTLQAPTAGNELAKRFLDPIKERFFEGYPPLLYANDLRSNDLPENIRFQEFYFQPATGSVTMRLSRITFL